MVERSCKEVRSGKEEDKLNLFWKQLFPQTFLLIGLKYPWKLMPTINCTPGSESVLNQKFLEDRHSTVFYFIFPMHLLNQYLMISYGMTNTVLDAGDLKIKRQM